MMTTVERVHLIREEISVLEARVELARKEQVKLQRMLSEKRLELDDVRRQQLAPLSVLPATLKLHG